MRPVDLGSEGIITPDEKRRNSAPAGHRRPRNQPSPCPGEVHELQELHVYHDGAPVTQ